MEALYNTFTNHWTNKDVVLEAIKRDGSNLVYADDSLKT